MQWSRKLRHYSEMCKTLLRRLYTFCWTQSLVQIYLWFPYIRLLSHLLLWSMRLFVFFSIGFKIHFTPFRTIKNIRRQPTIITTKFSGFISFWYNSVFFFELSVGDTHDLVNTEWYDILQYTINYTFWIFTILFYGYSSCTCIFYKPAVVSISVIFPWHPLTWSQSEILQIQVFTQRLP